MFSRLAQYLMSDFKGTPEKWAKIGMSQPDYKTVLFLLFWHAPLRVGSTIH